MPTGCNCDLFGYEVVEGRQVVAGLGGGEVRGDDGSGCRREVEHPVAAMVAQRVFGLALGDEDLVDHQLRHDPVLATLAGKLTTRRQEETGIRTT